MTAIRLNIQDSAQREQFRMALSSLPVEILEADGPPSPDILISDRYFAATVPTTDDHASEGSLATRPYGALLAIGWHGPADAVLPLDATSREIVLACSLLFEIVRLRQELSHHAVEQRRIRQLALTDALSGLANRRAWDEELVRQWKRPMEGRHPLVLAMVDLDRFKSVNDQCGHSFGDRVLQLAATAMSAGLRATDFIARFGGDEFGVLLDDCAAPAAVLERIHQAIRSRCYDPAIGHVTGSIGYAIRDASDTVTSFMERADAALRVAKESGRDRIVGDGEGVVMG